METFITSEVEGRKHEFMLLTMVRRICKIPQNSGIVWDPGQVTGSLCGRDVPIETFAFADELLMSLIDRSRH